MISQLDHDVIKILGWESRYGIPKHRDHKGNLVPSVKEPCLIGHWDGLRFRPIGHFTPSKNLNQAFDLIKDLPYLITCDSCIIDGYIGTGETLQIAICETFVKYKKGY